MADSPSRVDRIVQSFGGVADDYERGRPAYAPEALAFLAAQFSIGPRTRILDVGAGTGKLTRQLFDLGAHVFAIEPTEGMRNRLATNLPDVEILDGKAESIPMPDGSIDLIACGQSFHWFRTEDALMEFHRVLVSDGGIALFWNTRDESVPWIHKLSAIVDPYEPASRGVDASETWQATYGHVDLFQPLELETFRHVQLMDEDTLVAAAKSRSYIATLDEAKRTKVIEKIRQLVRTHPAIAGRERFDLVYITELYWSRRLG